MGRLSVVDSVKLNLSEVLVVLAGSSAMEVDMLAQVFSGFGVRDLRRAESVDELARVVAGGVDLLVADAVMDAAGVMEVVRNLRRAPDDSRYAPVVLTTTNASPAMLTQARDSGVNYVVVKPLAPRVLFERLVWIAKDRRGYVDSERYVGPDRRVRTLGPPSGMAGRRAGDLSAEVGAAKEPNMSQNDIDALMAPIRASV